MMTIFTYLGYPQAYILIVAVIYWSFDRKLGLRLALFLPVAASLNGILKQAFHAPRPYWLDPDIRGIRPSSGFGMPSGHAQASTVWLYAAVLKKRPWFWSVAILLAFMVGLSRIYLGVHFFSQVLLGWLVGILVLFHFAHLEKRVLPWFLGLKLFKQLLWIAGITLLILILGGLFVYRLKDWDIPLEWIKNAADEHAGTNKSILTSKGMGSVAGYAGGFLGVALGALLLHLRGVFDSGGSARKRFWRIAVGLISCLAIGGLALWIKPEETCQYIYSIWSFGAFFTISFSMIYLLPLLFRRLRLLDPE